MSPETGTITNNAFPSFVFHLEDKGVGADANTLELKSNNQVIPTVCTFEAISSNATCTIAQTLTDGVWDFTAIVKDYIGNQSESIQLTLTVDTVAPIVTVNSHWNGAYVNQSAQNITGSLSEFAELSLNSFPVALELNNNFSYPVLLFEGQNNFYLKLMMKLIIKVHYLL